MPGPGTKWIRELNRDPYYCSALNPTPDPKRRAPDPQSPMPTRSFDAFPEQAAAIPIRRAGRALQICVIRRKDANKWGIPKGLVDPGDTHEETALNEAWEEAGINGRLLGATIGTYRYRKWGTRLTVAVYVMEVLEQAERWEESAFRQRRWVPFAEAGVLLADHPVAPLLDRAHRLVTVGRFRIS
jgi:phosphohistidine phosphatase